MSPRFNGVYLMSVSGRGTNNSIAAGPNGIILTAKDSQDPTQQACLLPLDLTLNVYVVIL